MLELIKNKQFYHSSKVSKQGFDLIKKLLKFPSDKVFPCLDIYRMFLMHPHSSEHYKVFEVSLEFLNLLISHLKESTEPTVTVTLRCFVNLFNNNASQYVLLSKRQYILDNVAEYAYHPNKNIRAAALTLFLNYSILLLDKPDQEGRVQLLSAMSECFDQEKDAQNYLKLVTAVGNLAWQNKEVRDMMGGLGIKVKNASALEGTDEKTAGSIKDIAREIGLL